MEETRVSEEPEEKAPAVSDTIKHGIEKETELQKQAEELNRKYQADLDKKEAVPPKPKISPWLLASGATFLISGLAAFGPVGFAYIIFGLSSVGLGLESYKWFTRETPEQIARRERHEKEKAEKLAREKIESDRKTEKAEREQRMAQIKAAAQTPAISLTQAIKVFGLERNEFQSAQVIFYNDEHRVVHFANKKSNWNCTLHLEPKSYAFCLKDPTHALWYIIDTWKKLHD